MTSAVDGNINRTTTQAEDTNGESEILVRSMKRTDSGREIDPIRGELYLAGERVPPGLYRQIGAKREICLKAEDTLPASLDGRVACYERIDLNRIVIYSRHEAGSNGDRSGRS